MTMEDVQMYGRVIPSYDDEESAPRGKGMGLGELIGKLKTTPQGWHTRSTR